MSQGDFKLIDTNLPPNELLDKLANEYNRNVTQLQGILGGGITSTNQRVQVIEFDVELSAPVTFLNGWGNNTSGGDKEPGGYYRDSSGKVCLTGVLGGGLTGTIAFNLPVGYRPKYTHSFMIACWDSAPKTVWGRILVVAAGDVYLFEVEPGAVGPMQEWWIGDSPSFRTNEIRKPFPIVQSSKIGTPKGVYVWNIENKAHPTNQRSGSADVVWEATGKDGIRILDIPGLQEGNKYRVTLIAVSE